MIGFRSRYLPGGVHVMERTGAGDDLLLIHGIGADMTHWLGTAFFLGRRHTLRLLDLPLHGASADLQPLTFAGLEQTIVRAVADLPPSVVIGNSLGGAVALHLAVHLPDHVTGLFLISPAGPPMGQDTFDRVIGQFDMRNGADARVFLEHLYARFPRYGAVVVPITLAIFRRPVMGRLRAALSPQAGISTADAAQIRVPVALAWGQQDGVLPVSFRDWIAQHIVCERFDPEDEGHCPQLEQPRRLAHRILDWASRRSRAVGASA